ncbi:aldehyde dehydrogenase family protein [Microbacterium sp. MPKO10]|uniref:aldehyde dehydrogenase family protein n=1 Tax=Microbacterium sp. MPKO10 TaxID=2989818 RepID=UPI0022357A30|nr:aldehyde dehydrogenase family protein [Microbacterium sp. MPKO10]
MYEPEPNRIKGEPMSTKTTDAAAAVTHVRGAFERGVTKPYAWRREQLEALRSMILDNQEILERALFRDLGKHATEAQTTEIGFVLTELDHTLRHLRRWLRPRRVAVPLVLAPASARTVYEPLGTALIMGPWNYPVQLILAPLIGALAAGNAVVLKPSELAPATSEVLASLIPVYLDERAVTVVEGDVSVASDLLAQRFDHIFFTGSTAVGRIVAKAASENLTPVTLELGGKSPTFVDDTVDLVAAARRLVWGKLMNAGQTCVAPDYVLTTPRTADVLIPHLRRAIAEFYGEDPSLSVDYGRIITTRHTERLRDLLDGHDPVIGGRVDVDEQYVDPTVINGVDPDSAIMTEEIFGPILPIVHVADATEAVRFISARDKPLSLYVFSDDPAVRRRFLRDTSSGAIAFGVPAAHLTVPDLPFGGVGASGMGAYHGELSFTTFSHAKAVLSKGLIPDTLSLVYPPFTEGKSAIARRVIARTSPLLGGDDD